MSEYLAVPVFVGQTIAAQYCKARVVILAWDDVHELLHTTTYGVTALDKEVAAAVGDLCHQVAGGDLTRKTTFEDFRDGAIDAALFREATEIFRVIRARNGCTAPMMQQIERWLKAAGHEVRGDA